MYATRGSALYLRTLLLFQPHALSPAVFRPSAARPALEVGLTGHPFFRTKPPPVECPPLPWPCPALAHSAQDIRHPAGAAPGLPGASLGRRPFLKVQQAGRLGLSALQQRWLLFTAVYGSPCVLSSA